MDALQTSNPAASRDQRRPLRLSTNDIAPAERSGWLRDVICREYANVEVTSPTCQILSQDLTIYPWDRSRLSVIRSSAVGLRRLPREPLLAGQDAYFVVVLLSGDYVLEQEGKEVVLQPGDMTIYDATRPHKIHCPRDFSKLILAIPRLLLRERMAGVEHCAALRIPGSGGIGSVASRFLQSCGKNADEFAPNEILALADQAVDLVTLAAASVRPGGFSLSRSRALSMRRVKALVEERLADLELDTAKIARLAGLSARYLNGLFGDEGTSIMRYVWSRRLENCAKDFSDPRRAGDPLSEIAFRWGFSDASHFSRAFKQRFGCAPREFRRRR
ncbi:transcriptional regulator, AraC family [Methylocella silvestris BL2]|uniref:Transcriptional regulator, AraC family n=1 Tax=Methylocella silvestris (strain DSM 15510 / CIP 108128 / LMG 27833 / NCIMB 13906 / BL2) TaxID=395965 RepID=B8ETQ3_METSB|nr:helix-turn-helix domain-containing protein [Methylocella silvestris]ACK52405.1 transcriptional regulator, AraC family [Methylocella silvestris BL2]